MKLNQKFIQEKSLLLIFIGLILVYFSKPAFPSETSLLSEKDLSQVIENIKKREQNLKTFTAKFVQTKKTFLLREPIESEGLIYFERPDKVLFKVKHPSPMIVLIKKGQMQIYYPDFSKFEKRDIEGAGEIIKKYFGIGQSLEALKKEFQLKIISATDRYDLQLIPKKAAIAKRIDVIEITVNAKTWLLERIHFKESKGDYTTIRLHFTSINQPLSPGIFSIPLPSLN